MRHVLARRESAQSPLCCARDCAKTHARGSFLAHTLHAAELPKVLVISVLTFAIGQNYAWPHKTSRALGARFAWQCHSAVKSTSTDMVESR